ncbi:MAG: hypothetical protein CSYNP_01281 [Syntrophus sp. SKADARSKE-3]|nr:hypothetical protein [Syntrophus sp. SKADARSKE-3]
MDILFKVITVITSVVQAIAAGIAIYLFISQKDKIRSVFKLLVNYSFQTTLSELKAKLEKLNDYNVVDSDSKHVVLCVLNEIEGQISGNTILVEKCGMILKKLSRFTKNPNLLTEPMKRSLVSQLRETLRNIDIENYDELMKK